MKRFIPFLAAIIIIALLNSCSKDDEMFVENPHANQVLRSGNINIYEKPASTVVKGDSTKSHTKDEVKNDPVKNSNHWRIK
ncbi:MULTISPECIES: hypothetical protein [unclassified Chryseobacterium]|uniref:hypothetical protein n=1 Tax=unclassified Chryseobacterium TaxID=2593645 RepID=UPI00115ADD50|nr:hypothetical protein [Chryseobacterium sp. ON_d1]GEJ45970.1 hypothetical protein CRS_25780 [Chryseobacterium sp. ON_d1]